MQKLKRVLKTRNVIALLIVIAVVGYFIFPRLKDALEEKNEYMKDPSIAILPFVNVNNDPEQQYFSDGLTEEILNALARLKGLKVSAWYSSLQFKQKDVNVKDAGKKLDVHTVLEGRVQLMGDRIRITAQLIDVKNDFHLWSEKYDGSMDDIFVIQSKIATAVAEQLGIKLPENGRQLMATKSAPGKDAYELYLKGRASWNLRTPPDLKKGVDLFRQAIALYPSYAAAYAGIADCYTALGYGSFMAPREAFPKALEAATKALALDSTLAEPHASLGYYKFYYGWDWAAAEQEFRIAIALNPNYEYGYDCYGYYLTAMKRYDEAMIILKKADELDPLSVRIGTDMGFSFYYSGNYEPAIKELQASLQKNPKFPLALIWLGRTYQVKKMYPEAIAEYKRAAELSLNWPVALAAVGNVYGESGEKANAQKILDTLAALSSKRFVTSYGVALVYTGLGEKDQAFLWLKKAYEERSNWLVWLKSDPRWAPIRSDKRYMELVNKVGLPN